MKRSWYRAWFYSTSVIALLTVYQNCGHVAFDTPDSVVEASRSELASTSTLQINGGAPFTNQTTVRLGLTSPRALEMKISNQSDCADGSWEKFTNARAWTLVKTNQRANVYALFKDLMGNVSQCVNAGIVHDDVPPVAQFTTAAIKATNLANLAVGFAATDVLSGIDHVDCVDPSGVTSNCATGLTASAKGEGQNQITVRAFDRAGNVSADIVYAWVFDKTKPTVTITGAPAAVTGSPNAAVTFSGIDAGSGVDHYLCARSGGAPAPCTSPLNISGLADGAYFVSVQAVDAAGNVSDPALAKWTVNQTAPTLTFTQTPAAMTNQSVAVFAFTGTDHDQALSQFQCQLDDGPNKPCTSPNGLGALDAGPHTFKVQAPNSAGVMSSPISFRWLIDLTPPTLAFVSVPAANTNQQAITATFNASDLGSGIAATTCALDGGAAVKCNQASYPNLNEGPHSIQVTAIDGAGNRAQVTTSFNVDRTPPTVSITSQPAAVVNQVNAAFTFQGGDAGGIAGYQCRIDNGGFAPCATPLNINGLSEGGHVFFVTATDRAGNVSPAATASWTIDLTPPLIRVSRQPGTLSVGDHALIAFDVIDPTSGVGQVECALNGAVVACAAPYALDLGAMSAAGADQFVIVATDTVGNTARETINFQVSSKPVVCDPFVAGQDATCNGGLVGQIYYLPSDQQPTFAGLGSKSVDYFYASGTVENINLNLNQLFVSTRNFSLGFPMSGGGLVKDNVGQTLDRYFAFKLNTVLKLDPLVDLPGYYQFATLSDDGSMVLMQSAGSNAYAPLVSNDGDHSTRMGCSTQTVYIDDSTRLPLLIKYYQGPPTEIAMTLMWKRVDQATTQQDALCGAAGTNTFFGDGFNDFSPASGYGQLVSRGWHVIGATNFLAGTTN